MAENTQNFEIYGRKIFFLNSSFSIRQSIIEPLRHMEFEIYTITDFRTVKNYLRLYRGSILIVDPDTQLPPQVWLNFFSKLKEDPEQIYNDVDIGIISDWLTEDKKKIFEASELITAGIYSVEKRYEQTLATMSDKLLALNAIGRRKHVRSRNNPEDPVDLLWIVDGKLFKFSVIDISSISVAFLVDHSAMPMFRIGKTVDMSIVIKHKQYSVSMSVLFIKPGEKANICILNLTDMNTDDVVSAIYEYIFETLQLEVLRSVKGFSIDRTNYYVDAKM